MYEILVALDREEDRAESQAEAIAELPGAPEDVRVLLLHVFEDNPDGASVDRVSGVRAATESFEEAGIEHETLSESGDPGQEILDAATEYDVDVICVGGCHRSPTGKALFGSTAQQVILNAKQPVLTTSSN
ncbi:universal stress protein (plasmid) [Natrialbaceae archaeon A-arb3/5]